MSAQHDKTSTRHVSGEGEREIRFERAMHVDGERRVGTSVICGSREQVGTGQRTQVERARRGNRATCARGRWNDGRAAQKLQRARHGFAGRRRVHDPDGQVAPVKHRVSRKRGVDEFDTNSTPKRDVGSRHARAAAAATRNKQKNGHGQKPRAREKAPESAKREDHKFRGRHTSRSVRGVWHFLLPSRRDRAYRHGRSEAKGRGRLRGRGHRCWKRRGRSCGCRRWKSRGCLCGRGRWKRRGSCRG